MAGRLTCMRCSQPLTNDNIIVAVTGELFHQRCWQVPAPEPRAARPPKRRAKSSVSTQFVERDPICPVCLLPIESLDMVVGTRDDLMHADCDRAHPPE